MKLLRTVTWIVDLAKGESKVFSVIATVVGYGNVTNSLVVGNSTTGVNVTVPEKLRQSGTKQLTTKFLISVIM